MKKPWLFLLIPALGLGAALAYRYLPEKRYERHVAKARAYSQAGNLTAARMEYEAAHDAVGKFTPYADAEVLELMNRKYLSEGDTAEAVANAKTFVARDPEDRRGRILLAELAFLVGDLDLAFESAHTVLRTEPDHFRAHFLLARMRMRQGRPDLAGERLLLLYRRHPDSLQALLPLESELRRMGGYAQCIALLREILADRPEAPEIRLLLVDAYLSGNRVDSARAILDPWKEEPAWEAELIGAIDLRRARVRVLAGELEEADGLLSKYSGIGQENLSALSELAVIKAARGRYDSAVSIYRSLGEIYPEGKPGWQRMELLLFLKSGNPARALETAKTLEINGGDAQLTSYTLAAYHSLGQDHKVREVIAGRPDSLRIALAGMVERWERDREFIGQWALTEFYRLNGQPRLLLAAYGELHRRWPRNPLAISLNAAQAEANRDFAKAADLLESLRKPTYAQQLDLLGLLIRSDRTRKAEALAAAMIRENPSRPGLNAILGGLAWKKNEKDKGVAYYRKELAIDPGNASALSSLAWEYAIERKDFKAAQPFVEALRNATLRDADALDALGWILAKNGGLKEGESYVRMALNLMPDSPAFLYHMAWIHDQTGRQASAAGYLDSALKGDRPFGERREAETLHARLR